jgi:hypothetical protein
MDLGQAGVAGDFRQRNVFPLPEITLDEAGSSHETWRELANQGIKTLNELAEGLNSDFPKPKKLTRVQKRVQSQILDAYVDAYPDGAEFDCTDGLQKLCSSFRLYGSVRTDIKPYAADNISWPQADSRPVPLGRCLSEADSEWLGTWQSQMLRSDDTVTHEKVVPYVDPILKNNPHEYGRFIKELHSRNMLGFRVANGETGKLGIFFVAKKSGQLRLIFDTRLLNQDFREPPTTDLPSADSFTRMEMPENSQYYIGSGDLSNAFYTLSVPEELGRLFTLPSIKAKHLGLRDVDGVPVKPDTQVLPFLTVLPMGWSWALHLCQMVIIHAIRSSGIDESRIIGHKRTAVQLSGHNDIAVAGYVDNFGIFGCSKAAVDRGRMAIAERLREWGLSVHEEEEAQLKGEFIGLLFNGEKGYVSVKPSRLLKLRAGVQDLLNRQFCTGHTLQLVLGHCTWAMMARRESLSLLHHSYSFCHQHFNQPTRIWPSVRQELHWIISILPLLRCKINNGWSCDVTASDSSPWGLGVCERKISTTTAAELGSVSERWRFQFEDATRARKHALDSLTVNGSGVDAGTGSCERVDVNDDVQMKQSEQGSFSSFIVDQGFDEVPSSLFIKNDWHVVWSRPWKYEANILNTEARALCWSLEHLLRSNRNINKRLLCFSDNLPLVLGTCKGRAKSGHLLKPLRKIAGLLLATGSRLSVRWVASEINVADAPSRAIALWKSRNWDRWWEGLVKEPDFRKTTDSVTSKFFGKGSARFSTGLSRQGRSKPRAPPEDDGINLGSPRVDLSGDEKRETTDDQGLPATTGQISKMVDPIICPSHKPGGSGPVSGRVHERDVFQRGGNRHRDQSACCGQILLPPAWKTQFWNIATDSPGFEGVGHCDPTSSTTSSSNRGSGCNHGTDDEVEQGRDGSQGFHSIPDLSPTGRTVRTDCRADGSPTRSNGGSVQKLGHFASSGGERSAWQDRSFRCNSPDRFRPMVTPNPCQHDLQPKAAGSPMARLTSSPGQDLFWNHSRSGIGTSGKLFVHSSTWGRDSRHHHTPQKYAGGQAKGPVADRFIAPSLREASKTPARAVEDSKVDSGTRSRGAGKPTSTLATCSSERRGATWNPNITKRMQKKASLKPKQQQLNGVQLLKQLFKEAVKKAKVKKRQVFLDLFCGDQGISKNIAKQGFGVVSIDICIDPRLNLCSPCIQNLILGWIRSRCILGVWLATPCPTWSRARHGPIGSGWGPLRDSQHLFGLPGLNVGDRSKIRLGNMTTRFSFRVIDACRQTMVPCLFENPVNSMIWLIPRLSALCSVDCSRLYSCDFCQFGAKWRKRTRVQGWHIQDSELLQCKCSGRNGWCPRNNRYHIVLKGQDPITKQLWTHLAQPYPTNFARAGANLLIQSSLNLSDFFLRQRFGN